MTNPNRPASFKVPTYLNCNPWSQYVAVCFSQAAFNAVCKDAGVQTEAYMLQSFLTQTMEAFAQCSAGTKHATTAFAEPEE